MKKKSLLVKLESYHDIYLDLREIIASSNWIAENFYDLNIIPIPEIDGQFVHLRNLYLDALLIKYRRCFSQGHRVNLRHDCAEEVLGEFVVCHRDMINRANQLVAHAISASSSTTVKILNGKACPSSFRPGVNKFDFTNLIIISDLWLKYLDKKIKHTTSQFESLLTPSDNQESTIFVAPWGSNVDMQGLRAKAKK